MSFKWLFETFLSAMSGKQPKTIFTDQSAAMANAIEDVFPESNHRLCVWHIIRMLLSVYIIYLIHPANFEMILVIV